MKDKIKKFYMDTVDRTAELSYCERKKVGAIIVQGNSIISYGYNGTLPGDENFCELSDGTTAPNVAHAEINAIAKVARSNHSTEGAIMFITMMPCHECAKLIVQSGIKTVYYKETYRLDTGLNMLLDHGIEVIHYNPDL